MDDWIKLEQQLYTALHYAREDMEYHRRMIGKSQERINRLAIALATVKKLKPKEETSQEGEHPEGER